MTMEEWMVLMGIAMVATAVIAGLGAFIMATFRR